MTHRIRLYLTAALAIVLLGGCASDQRAPDPRDPWEGMNRHLFGFNEGLDKAIIKPVARGYNAVLPGPVKTGVGNFFDNLGDVVTTVNSFLQGKVDQGLNDGSRVLWNSTLGIAGIFDPATHMDLPRHQEDFGQTLGVWFGRENTGPFLIIPVLGPSTVRDGVGIVGDIFIWPVYWAPVESWVSWTLAGVAYVETRASLLEAEKVIDIAAVDRYAFLRDAYLQRRRNLVWDGNPPPLEGEDDDTFEDEFEPDPADVPNRASGPRR